FYLPPPAPSPQPLPPEGRGERSTPPSPLGGEGPGVRGSSLVYQPRVLACAEVVFTDRRKGLEHRRPYRLLAEPPAAGQPANWIASEPLAGEPSEAPAPNAHWAGVPESVDSARKLKALEKSFAEYLYGNAKLRLLENRKLGLVSEPREDAQAFQERCR